MKVKITLKHGCKQAKQGTNNFVASGAARGCPEPVFEFDNPAGRPNPFEETELTRGLKLIVFSDHMPERHSLDFEVDNAPLEFSFPVSGQVSCLFDHGMGKKTAMDFDHMKSHILYYPNTRGTLTHTGESPMGKVEIHMAPEFLLTFFAGQEDGFPPVIQQIANGTTKDFSIFSGPMTAAMQVAVHQIIHCSYHGLMKKIYLESKVLELVSLKCIQVARQNRSRERFKKLVPRDIEKIHAARDILIDNMETPPSLPELCRKTGLNEFKLKMGFRQVFGTSAFDLLRRHRMEKARLLLHEGRMNVNETALAVGYSSAGYFAGAFKKQFGTTPGKYLSEVREMTSF
ncbi:MAG: helix-turn-helix transcriptional regulator [Desulfobacteraceae bacterium]|nr:helix-turn-helix transcriptional regulator [Desulfobacteraceae bacterium]